MEIIEKVVIVVFSIIIGLIGVFLFIPEVNIGTANSVQNHIKIKNPCVDFADQEGKVNITKFEDCINSMNLIPKESEKIIQEMIDYIKVYVNEDIMLNPPWNINSYELVNELNRLKSSSYSSFYEFWSKIQSVISKMNDSHFLLAFNYTSSAFRSIIRNIYFRLDQKIKEDDIPGNGIYIKTKILFNKWIDKYEKIKTINGKDPIEWLTNYGSEKGSFKSTHNQYKRGLKYLKEGNLFDTPLTMDELKQEIEIVTEKGTKIKCKYKLIYSTTNILSREKRKLKKPEEFVEYYCPSNSSRNFTFQDKFICCTNDDPKQINSIIKRE